MTPEEVTQLFVRVSEKFEPITDQPSDADLHRLTETLSEALLPISWDRAHNGAGNLVGIVWDAHLYIQQFGQAFVEPIEHAAHAWGVAGCPASAGAPPDEQGRQAEHQQRGRGGFRDNRDIVLGPERLGDG